MIPMRSTFSTSFESIRRLPRRFRLVYKNTAPHRRRQSGESSTVFQKPAVQLGDRFIKVGKNKSATWVVEMIFQLPSEPPHARLGKEGDEHDTITVSLPALADPRLFKRV